MQGKKLRAELDCHWVQTAVDEDKQSLLIGQFQWCLEMYEVCIMM